LAFAARAHVRALSKRNRDDLILMFIILECFDFKIHGLFPEANATVHRPRGTSGPL
jgi:hypothetical protein